MQQNEEYEKDEKKNTRSCQRKYKGEDRGAERAGAAGGEGAQWSITNLPLV